MDGVWWTGVLDDRTGTFPSNYVQPRPTANQASIYATPRSIQEQPVLSPQTPNQSSSSMASMASSSVVGSECRPGKPLIARVCVAFKSSKPGQLSLDYGELVKVRTITSDPCCLPACPSVKVLVYLLPTVV